MRDLLVPPERTVSNTYEEKLKRQNEKKLKRQNKSRPRRPRSAGGGGGGGRSRTKSLPHDPRRRERPPHDNELTMPVLPGGTGALRPLYLNSRVPAFMLSRAVRVSPARTVGRHAPVTRKAERADAMQRLSRTAWASPSQRHDDESDEDEQGANSSPTRMGTTAASMATKALLASMLPTASASATPALQRPKTPDVLPAVEPHGRWAVPRAQHLSLIHI